MASKKNAWILDKISKLALFTLKMSLVIRHLQLNDLCENASNRLGTFSNKHRLELTDQGNLALTPCVFESTQQGAGQGTFGPVTPMAPCATSLFHTSATALDCDIIH